MEAQQHSQPTERLIMIIKMSLLCWPILVGLLFIRPVNLVAQLEPSESGSSGFGQPDSAATILPPMQMRPDAQVNVREWSLKLADDIRSVSGKATCVQTIRDHFADAEIQVLEPAKMRDQMLNQINNLLAQHRAAVQAISSEAEKFAMEHKFVKDLCFNYTDVHRLRNELDNGAQMAPEQPGAPSTTSINGGTPVLGAPEWQTAYKSLAMQLNKNFGDLPVNTSVSAVHLPLPIYPGLPEIINGIFWTEKLDSVFRRNLAQFVHVHHQYYGDHLGFLRTFPAHKWRIPRTEPDLFDARVRPWYIAGTSSPKDVVILIDTSGSMTGLRREIAKGVVFEILDTLTNSDRFSVMRFSETVTPIGFPRCNLRKPRFSVELDEQCPSESMSPSEPLRDRLECQNYWRQLENRGQYLRDHPNVVLGKNGSYMTDEVYHKSVYNVTQQIKDAYLLPATSRNIRYLKSNFSMPTAGIANFTHAFMAAFELLQAHNRTTEWAQCNQAIMLITDGAIKSHEDLFNRYNYPRTPVRVFTFMIGREVGDITKTKAIACNNRGHYMHVINLSEVREQVQKYLLVMARPMVLAHQHPITWTGAYGDETYQVLTDWLLEVKRRERAKIVLNEERDRLSQSDWIDFELTGIPEYDENPLVAQLLSDFTVCEDSYPELMQQIIANQTDPLGYNDLGCHWTTRRADLLTSVVRPVFDNRNTTIFFQHVLQKNVPVDQELHVRNALLLGVAAVDLRIADIIQPVAPSHLLGPNAYAILLGPSGFIMHHPDHRALLEDPFDKQSRLLKPFFNAVDLTHVEQVYHRNESDLIRNRADDNKLLKLREAALRQSTGSELFYVKRAVDCKRRLHIRQQQFFYGPIKDTPFSFMIALPQSYGLNRVQARAELNRDSAAAFKSSPTDWWTVHPDYRYCGGRALENKANSSREVVQQVLDMVDAGSAGSVGYTDLASLTAKANEERLVCDRDLFKSLLFDAKATYDKPDTICGQDTHRDCDQSSSFGAYFDSSCSENTDGMRSKLASIYGVELSFLATRSGLTRARAFNANNRTEILAAIFLQKHGRAVDEAWYARTVDWNMRFNESATIISAPYNAYVRLVAKLRQRITERNPDGVCKEVNETDTAEPDASSTIQSIKTSSETMEPLLGLQIQSDQPASSGESSDESGSGVGSSNDSAGADREASDADHIDYSAYSSFDLLDLLADSSVHIAGTRSIIVSRHNKLRSPVAVTGLLYDYATFARRFLNSTSLRVSSQQDDRQQQVKVDLCPGGQCPTKCGMRNDSIDCLLLDNNGFIVVGEELAHIGRSLVDYDENLMQALVERRVYHKIQISDYQAICARNDPGDQNRPASSGPSASSSSMFSSPAASNIWPRKPSQIGFEVASRALASNALAALSWIYSMVSGALLAGISLSGDGELLMVDAQTASANQTVLSLLPNKTYLRACERTMSLYETRPSDPGKMLNDKPQYYVTRCGCSGWFVHDQVPDTNLVLLIVNTSISCRRCEINAANANFVPAPVPVADLANGGVSTGGLVANKTAEDQVCAMLEREAQLYPKRPDNCYAYHPDESQINICGSANRSREVCALLFYLAGGFTCLWALLGARQRASWIQG